MSDELFEDTPLDECEDPENCLIHGPNPETRDILFVEGFEVTTGNLHLEYGGGLDQDVEELYAEDEQLAPASYIRLHCIEPQTGQKLHFTFATSPFMGHAMGLHLASSAFNKTVRLPHVWEPARTDTEDQEIKVAASWEGWKAFMEDSDDEENE